MSSMKSLRYILAPVVAVMLMSLASCLKNDIPYPKIEAKFLSMAAEGEVSGAVIDD